MTTSPDDEDPRNQPPSPWASNDPQQPGPGQPYPGGQPPQYPGGQPPQYPGGQPPPYPPGGQPPQYPGGQPPQYPPPGYQQYPGQAYPGQPYPGQPYPGQPPYGDPYQQYQPYPQGGYGGDDPLFAPPGSPLSAWWAKVVSIVQRSWRTVLVITLLGIALPTAVIRFVSWLTYGYLAIDPTISTRLSDLPLGRLFGGAAITFVVAVVASFVIAAGWAAAVWAITVEANGERASIGAAFSYGFSRAVALWGWTILVGLIVGLGTLCFVLPGLYLLFALCLFGLVVLYERGANPIGRSFTLTHARFGPTLARVLILVIIVGVYSWVIGLIIGAIQRSIVSDTTVGTDISIGNRVGLGFVEAIGSIIVETPVTALLAMGLIATYGELRARETPLATPVLRQELGG